MFLKSAKNVFFSAQNILDPLLSLYILKSYWKTRKHWIWKDKND